MSWLKDKVGELFGQKPQPKSVAYERTIVIRATVAANLAAGSIVPITLLVDPVTGAVSSYKIPAGETWVIDDLFVSATQSPDGYLKLRKNFREEVLPLSPRVNSLLVSNPSRPKITPIVLNQFEDLDGFYITAAAQGSSATTVEVFAHVTVYR